MSSTEFLKDNDNTIQLADFKDIDGVFENNAVVSVIVFDSDGIEVTGQVWPTSMPHVTAVDGLYRGVLSAAINVTAGDRLTAVITADAGVGRLSAWTCKYSVVDRLCCECS